MRSKDLKMKTIFAGAVLFALTPLAPAVAHVTLADAKAAPGAYFVSAFRVGHGCGASATTAIRVEIPEAILLVRPQPKPGWTLEIERAPLPAPKPGEGGKPVADRVKAITWRGGPLPEDEFDAFGFMAKLPSQPGKLYFPVVQTCVQGEARWIEIPGPSGARLSHPAPMLEITGGGSDDMAGMDMGGGAPKP
jgi:uncharacterized protein YcnI